MSKKKILMITSETVPFAKTGGLADVITDLSLELKKQGHDVRIVLPRYYHIDRGSLHKHIEPLSVWMDGKEEWMGVFESFIGEGETACPVYFLDHERYYGREGIYGPKPDIAFADNAARYALMCRGALQLCRMIHWIPQILHCHDWTAAPVCYLLQKEERLKDFAQSAGVLTIHNLGYQGIFGLEESRYIQSDVDSYSLSTLEFEGNLNFLKSGIMSAHMVTTVSPTYAREIQEPEQGFNLNGLLHYRRDDLRGILNGIDYDIWNPQIDPYLYGMNFSQENIRIKSQVKKKLQQEMGLPVDSTIPLVGIISRLVDQKGIKEMFLPHTGAVERICRDYNIQFALLGSGESWCEAEITRLSQIYPQFSAHLGYNNDLAHKMEGGCDFFLMPSRYEPCGLNQIYSLSYGTLPIVRATGGLADTVINYNQKNGTGTGFVFDDLTPDVLYNVLKWVIETWYERRDHVRKMRKKAMTIRYSWSRSAEKYDEVYDQALTKLIP